MKYRKFRPFPLLVVLLVAIVPVAAGCTEFAPKERPIAPSARPLVWEGVPIGASLIEVRKAQPNLVPAQKSPDGHVQMLYGKNLSPMGIAARQSGGALYDGRLVEIYVKFDPADAARVYHKLVEAYGKPGIETDPDKCRGDYSGCGASWYNGDSALTFDGAQSRYALVDQTRIKQVQTSMARAK